MYIKLSVSENIVNLDGLMKHRGRIESGGWLFPHDSISAALDSLIFFSLRKTHRDIYSLDRYIWIFLRDRQMDF